MGWQEVASSMPVLVFIGLCLRAGRNSGFDKSVANHHEKSMQQLEYPVLLNDQ